MEILQRAGMKYFSFTSKHHEGFCLWPTKTLQRGFRKQADGTFEEVTNHYSIAETPCKKDIIGELVRSARAHDIGVSLYYSHIDWHDYDFGWDKRNFWYDPKFTRESDPQRWAAFIQKERQQITELLTSYGPIDRHGPAVHAEQGPKVCLYHQPQVARDHLVINNAGAPLMLFLPAGDCVQPPMDKHAKADEVPRRPRCRRSVAEIRVVA